MSGSRGRAESDNEFTLPVWVKPGASADRVGGARGDALIVAVAAKAADGAANAAVCRVVARALGLRPRHVALEHGFTARTKLLRVDASTGEKSVEELKARVGQLMAS